MLRRRTPSTSTSFVVRRADAFRVPTSRLASSIPISVARSTVKPISSSVMPEATTLLPLMPMRARFLRHSSKPAMPSCTSTPITTLVPSIAATRRLPWRRFSNEQRVGAHGDPLVTGDSEPRSVHDDTSDGQSRLDLEFLKLTFDTAELALLLLAHRADARIGEQVLAFPCEVLALLQSRKLIDGFAAMAHRTS